MNVTLIFSVERYVEVAEAYIAGLEDRLADGNPIDTVSSVASFFISRIDTKLKHELIQHDLRRYDGLVAIASGKLSYQIFKKLFMSDRFKKLQAK